MKVIKWCKDLIFFEYVCLIIIAGAISGLILTIFDIIGVL